MKDRAYSQLWKQALVVAIVFHLGLFAAFIWGPNLFKTKRDNQIPYTVKLMAPSSVSSQKAQGTNLPKPQEKVQKNKPAPKPVEKKTVPKKVQKQVPKKEKQVPVKKVVKKVVKKTPEKKKAISLKPKHPKKKVVKKKDNKKVKKKTASQKEKVGKRLSEKSIEERIKEINRRLQEKKEEEYLKKRLEELEKKKRAKTTSGSGTGSGSGAGSGNKQALIYGNFVKAKIWRNWHFPKALANRSDLSAQVTITITKDGRILDMQIKKYSGFAAFDRSVIRAIKESAPLPPLPPSLGSGPEEIDITFDLSKARSH